MIGDFNKFVLGRQSRRLLALGLIAGGLSLTACGDDDPPKPTPTPDMGGDMDENNNNGTPAALTISPIMQNFGSVLVGETSAASTFTVTNTGESPSSAAAVGVEGAASADFAITANTCAGATIAGGATCTISVTFSPGAVGARAATLSVSAADGGAANAALEGSGTGEGDLTITPSLRAFGDVIVGETSDVQTFTIRNPGSAATDALSTVVTGDHASNYDVTADTCAGTELAPGATCEVSIAFSPDSRGDKSATLSVAGGGLTVTGGLSGRGLTEATLGISAASHNFGDLTIGNTSNPFTLTITNSGDVAAAAVASNVTGDAADFNVASTCGASLAAGASCTVSVSFAPQTEGNKTATVSLTATPGGTISATVTGRGLSLGDIVASDPSHNFGSTMAGTTGSSETFTFTNGGGGPTGVLSTALGGTNASSFSIVPGSNGCQGITLASGASCTVTVEFAPATEGAKTASLTVNGNPGGSAVVSLEGTATAVITPAQFELTPASRNFGSVATGSESAALSFTVTNIGGATTAIPVVDIVTQNFADFSISANGCSAPLVAGANCEVQVRFIPSGTPGTRSSTLRVQGASGGAGGTDSSVLQGVALSPAQLNLLTGSASTIGFGSWINGSQSTTETRTFVNNGTQATDPIVTAVTGQFAIVTDTCNGATLANGQQCSVTTRFVPTTLGAQVGTLTVDGGVGDSVDVGLTGQSLVEYTFTLVPTTDDGDYGEVIVTQNATKTFQVTNATGNGESTRTVTPAISGQHAAQFAFTPSTPVVGDCRHATSRTLDAGDSCTFTVQFNPVAPHGARTASVDVALTGGLTGSIAVNGFALVLSNDLTFNNDNVDFALFTNSVADAAGQDLVGSTDTFEFILTNESLAPSGTLSVAFSGGTNFGIISNTCAGAYLLTNDTCEIEVRFYPTAEQTYTGFLTVNNEVATIGRADFRGTGVSPAELEISGNGDFGDVIATRTVSRTLTVTNTGGQMTSALAAATISGTNAGLFTIEQDDCVGEILEFNETCTIEVEYTAPPTQALGDKSATLNISAATGGAATQSLEAVALTQMRISGNPDFGNQRVDTNSAARGFTLHNDGSDPIPAGTTFNFGSTTQFEVVTNNCGTVAIPAGGQLTNCMTVRFTPDTTNGGELIEFVLQVTGPAAGAGDDSSITLNGNGIAPDLAFSVASDDFGFVTIGQSEQRIYTLQNTGTDAATPLALTTSPNPMANFSVTHNCGTSLAANASCQVTVTFAPTNTTVQSPIITISDDLTSAALQVTGQILPAGELRVTPGQVFFPDTEQGSVSAVQSFVVTNDNLALATNLTIANNNTTNFCVGAACGTTNVAADACTGENLANGDSCTFQVRFTPGAPGNFLATLTIDGNDVLPTQTLLVGRGLSSASLALTGQNAFAPTASNATRMETFTVTNSGEVASAALTTSMLGGVNGVRLTITRDTCNGQTVAPNNGTCEIDITFDPNNLELTANNDLSVSGLASVTITATSVTPPTLTFSVANLDCGTVPIGTDVHCGSMFTVTNTGALPTEELTETRIGDNQFYVYPGISCDGVTLGAGDSCTIDIHYQSTTVGSHTGSVTLTDGSATGTGTFEGVSTTGWTNNTTDDEYEFADLGVTCSSSHSITFTNVASGITSGVLSVSLEGTNANQFSYTSTCPGTTRNPGQTCSVTVFFVPTTVGVKTATLVVGDNTTEFTSTVTLTGEADTSSCP